MLRLLKNRKIIFSFIIWLFSIGLFDVIFLFKKEIQLLKNIEFLFLTIIVIGGIIAFLVFILNFKNLLSEKYSPLKANILAFFLYTYFLFFGFIILIFPFIKNNEFPKVEKTSNKQEQVLKKFLISSELKLGSSGEDVKVLQSALSTDKSIYPSGLVSGYYGELTRQAVINFQKKYNLPQTGEIDEKTAYKFNEIYGDKTRDYYLTLFPTPTRIFLVGENNNQKNIKDNEEWGVAKQISERTWRMKVGQDQRMATAKEIFEALNVYRQRHGRNSLQWDDRLATYALSRAKYFTQIQNLDEHKGFEEYVRDENNLETLGFWLVGENASYGYKLEGVHLIEWVFAGDEPHNKNQLNPQWTHVGIGVDGYNVDIIFGAYPM